MSDDLVERLRAIDKDIILRRFDPEMSFDGMTAHEAASHIEKLEAALSLSKDWIEKQAVHAGDLCTSKQCVCGKALVLFNARKALEEKDD